MGQDQLDKFLKEKLGQHQSPVDNDALWKNIQAKKGPKIEPIIKDKLSQYEAPIDSQVIWNNIENNVTAKPTISWVKIAIALLLIVGALITTGLLVQRESNVNNNVNSAKTNTYNSEKINYDNTDNDSNKINDNNKTTEEVKQGINSNVSNNVNLNSDILSPESNITVDRNSEIITGTPLSQVNQESTSNDGNNSIIENSNDVNAKRLVSTATDSEINRNQLRLTKESLSILTQSINNISKDNNRELTTSASSIVLLNYPSLNISSGSTKSALDYLDGLPKKDICFPWNKSIQCYDYSPKKYHFSILAYTTADYYSKSMTYISEQEPENNYLVNRKNTQKVQISNRSGLLLKLMHKKGLYVKVGVESGFLRERFSYQTRDTMTEIIPDQLINIDVNMNGDSIYTYGNAAVTTISTKNWRVNNTHRTIGVPVLLGYEKKLKRFDLGMEMGMIYNFNRSFEGWLLGLPEIPSDAKEYFTSSNDINITGGINLIYKLNDRFNLLGIASFRRDLSTINNELINSVNQKNTTYGIGIGLEFKI